MHPHALVRLPILLAVLVLAASTVSAGTDLAVTNDPAITTVSIDPDGVRLRVDVPADTESWQGLLAVPSGKRAQLLDAPEGVSLGQPAILHGVQLVSLTVRPSVGDLGARDVAVAFVTDSDAVVSPRTRIAATFANLLESQVIGGAGLRDQYEVVPGTYLMIVASAVGAVEAVEPLLEWRRRQGYDVQVATTIQTGAINTQIKSYIQQVYDTADSPLAYVCLVGDANGSVSVATWRETVSGYWGEGDHYYTNLDGNDVLSDVHIGRLSARNVSELEGIVQKILAYERAPDTFTDPGWFSRATLVGDPSASGNTTILVNQWLKEVHLEPLGYTQIDTIWTYPFATRITASLNQGTSVYSYRGYLGCSGFSTGYIDNLNNGYELPFAVMTTCASGSFYSDTHSYTEAMLRNPNGGAIGAVGTATTGTHTRYNNCYFHGVWQGAMGEPDRRLGYAHTRGKLELYAQYIAAEPNIVEVWSVWNNLMGDPATEMRQALPLSPQVSYPQELPPDAGALPVTVANGLGSPLVGVKVAAYQAGSVLVAGWTDDSGQVLLPLPAGATPGLMHVTVTGDDLVPHRGTATLGAVTAYCVQSGWIWTDDNDGMPDPGETGDLTVSVRNLGQSVAQAVTANLAPLSAGIGVSTGDIFIGDLAAGASVQAGPWNVSLPDDLVDGAEAALSLTAFTDTETWLSRVDLPVSAPTFEVTSADWNGLPGETSLLQVTMRNAGGVAAMGAEVTFGSNSGFVLPAGPVTIDLGDVVPAATVVANFNLAVAEEAWGGHLIDATLTITTGAGTRQVIEVPLAVGGVGPESPVGPGNLGYLAWEDQDPSPDAPTYAWRELDPGYGGNGADVGLTDFSYEADDTRTVDLPFTFRFNGVDYDQLSICSNGWVSLGQTYLAHWRNWGLPAAGAPDHMLAVFWDDLVQSGSNRVYHEYHEADGVYVVQWSRMRNRVNGQQNCEVVLYDPAVHPTATGDGLIVYQYAQVTNNDTSRGYATVGMQDGADGLGYTYYNRYADGARTLQAGRAIAWVPTPPQVPAAGSISPSSFNLILMPGQTGQRTLVIDSIGPEGSVLHWQVGLQESAGAKAGDDTRDPLVTVLEPNGGETWTVGQSRMIRWDASVDVVDVRLQLDRGLGDGFETLFASVPASVGSWSWPVSSPTSSACRVRIVNVDDIFVSDTSDGTFSISVDESWLTVTPTEGQTPAGETAEVSITVDATGLALGEYTVEIVVLSSGGAPVVVPLHLLVDETTATPEIPVGLALAQNAPNPFNPATSITFALPRDVHVELTVHDLRGRLVRRLGSGTMTAGMHEVRFDGNGNDGRRLASGTYIYRLKAGDELLTRRLTMVK